MPGVKVISGLVCGTIAVALPGGSVMLPPWLCFEARERATINASWLSSLCELPGAGRMREGVASAVGRLLIGTDIDAVCFGCGGAAFCDVCSLGGMMPTCCGIAAGASMGAL